MRRTLLVLSVVTGLVTAFPGAADAETRKRTILFGNLGFSTVIIEMQAASCNASPASQGTDGYAFDIGGASTFTARATWAAQGTVNADVNLYFLNSVCQVVGSNASPADEVGVKVPAGTRYVVAHLSIGANVELTATWS